VLNEVDPSKVQTLPWRLEEAHAAEVELERARWAEITSLIVLLGPDELLAPGYYGDPSWSVKDLIAHLGAWMAEARVQLLDIAAHSYVAHEVDVEGRNATTLAAEHAEPWDRVWSRTTGARAWMLEAWFALREPADAANQWVRKAGAEHYGEHLGRLREWVSEVIYMRTHPRVEEWDT
jgi:hypothetical protein